MYESFISHVFSNYSRHCTDKQLQPNTANFLDYLMTQNLIYEDAVRHYVILEEFEQMMEMRKFKNKTQTVKSLARSFNLHENTIWHILKTHHDKFMADGSKTD